MGVLGGQGKKCRNWCEIAKVMVRTTMCVWKISVDNLWETLVCFSFGWPSSHVFSRQFGTALHISWPISNTFHYIHLNIIKYWAIELPNTVFHLQPQNNQNWICCYSMCWSISFEWIKRVNEITRPKFTQILVHLIPSWPPRASHRPWMPQRLKHLPWHRVHQQNMASLTEKMMASTWIWAIPLNFQINPYFTIL